MYKIETLVTILLKLNFNKQLNAYLSILIIIALNIILFLKFGDKFGDLIIDVSREVTVPLRILEGQVLYKDFHYEYGPLVPYLFSIICYIFGTDLDVFRITGLIISLSISIVIFTLSKDYLNKKFSLLVSTVFVFVFAFHSLDVNIFNYIFPYSYSSTIGVLLLLLLYKSIYDYFVKNNNAALYIVIIIFLLCFLTKLEIILSAVAAMTVFLFFFLEEKKLFQLDKIESFFNLKLLSWSIFSLLIFVLSLYLMGLIEYFYDEIIYLIKQNLSSPIGRGALGIDHIFYYFFRSIKSIVFFVVSGCIFIYLDKGTSNKVKQKIIRLILYLLSLIIFSFYLYVKGYDYFYNGTGLLLVLSILLVGLLIKSRVLNRRDKMMLVMLISSLALTFRMAFNNTVEFYGFYLLAPASVCLLIMIFHYIPLLIRYKYMKRTHYFKTAFSIFFIIMSWAAYSNTSNLAAKKNELLNTEKGDFYVYPHQHYAAQTFLDEFKSKIKKDDSIIVLPEGYMLNYFLNITPTTFNNSHIPDLVMGEREKDLLKEMEEKQFDYVIILSRYTPEWDLPVMGKDYLVNTVRYIYEKYEPTYLFGDIPFSGWQKFGILVFEKKLDTDYEG